jgi:hypothetical protein
MEALFFSGVNCKWQCTDELVKADWPIPRLSLIFCDRRSHSSRGCSKQKRLHGLLKIKTAAGKILWTLTGQQNFRFKRTMLGDVMMSVERRTRWKKRTRARSHNRVQQYRYAMEAARSMVSREETRQLLCQV